MNKINTIDGSSMKEKSGRENFFEKFKNSPIPKDEIMGNLGLYIDRKTLSRILFMHELYKKIIDVHGVAMEFGVRWGQNLALFESFRGMYEPFNYNRKIVGFDTFSGFPSVNSKDGSLINASDYGVTDGYEEHLASILDYHESESPIAHIKKYELIKGDASCTIKEYLAKHPETIVALAYFDLDIYEPTKVCLEAIKPHLTKGSIVAFDELNCANFPGETLAVKETLGLDRYALKRSPISSTSSYFLVE